MPEPFTPGEARMFMQMAEHDVAVRAFDEERDDRNKWRKVWLGVAIAGLMVGVWMGRYQVVPASNAAHLRLDRWTGDVAYCVGTGCYELSGEARGPLPKPHY